MIILHGGPVLFANEVKRHKTHPNKCAGDAAAVIPASAVRVRLRFREYQHHGHAVLPANFWQAHLEICKFQKLGLSLVSVCDVMSQSFCNETSK